MNELHYYLTPEETMTMLGTAVKNLQPHRTVAVAWRDVTEPDYHVDSDAMDRATRPSLLGSLRRFVEITSELSRENPIAKGLLSLREPELGKGTSPLMEMSLRTNNGKRLVLAYHAQMGMGGTLQHTWLFTRTGRRGGRQNKHG